MKIISLINSKGGVGKTTLAINLARYVQLYHCNNLHHDKSTKVLVVDTDQQGSLRDWHDAGGAEYLDVLIADRKSVITQLPETLKKTNYEYVFIDTPGTMNEIIGSAISISDVVLIPLQPSPFDVWASKDVLEVIDTRHNALLTSLPKAFYVVNGCVKGTKAEKDVIDYLYKGKVVPLYQTVYRRVSYAESASSACTIFESNNKLAINEISLLGSQLLEQIKGEYK